MKYLVSTLLMVGLTSLGSIHAAAEPAPAPDTTFLLSAEGLLQGQSSNLGPVVNQILDEYYRLGDCPLLGSYDYCDELRFGLGVFPPDTCAEGLSILVDPDEDHGEFVEDRMQLIHTEAGSSYCNDAQYRPFDTALDEQHRYTFPTRSSPTEAELDQYWERPRLSLMMIADFPQKQNGQPDDRVIKSINQACENLAGGTNADLPSMPTWVMALRRASDAAAQYGQLLAAAGGTGVCCYGAGCDPVADEIDVCDHVNDGRSEMKIRTDLASGRYNCGSTSSLFSTGVMAFNDSESKYGTKPEIGCLLAGEGRGRNCSSNGRVDLDLLGIFSCIRQLPRGVAPGDVEVTFCPPAEDDDEDGDGCEVLTEENGGITFIDERKTLFIVNDRDKCEILAGGGDVEITYCKFEGQYCLVDGNVGRCAPGQYQCINNVDVCVPLFDPMPEICNGLDDDCDGEIDNFRESWEDTFPNMSLPTDHEGLNCDLKSVCVCPDGNTDNHFGTTYDQYLDAWSGVCGCGEGLSAPEPMTPAPTQSVDEPQAGCSSSDASASALPGLLILLGLMFKRRRL